jgi:4-hydroxythreonine-4-phosphate dehydrogenase
MSNPTKPFIAITMGDPAGIGPEIIAKALVRPEIYRWCRPVVAGDSGVFQTVIRRNRLPLRLDEITDVRSAAPSRKVMALHPCVKVALSGLRPGVSTPETGRAALEAIQAAVRLATVGSVSAVTTAPISKEALKAAGSPHPGHTELLADLTATPEVGMLMVGGRLRIMLVTTHLALRDVPMQLTASRVLTAIRLADRSARQHFGIPRPRIAVAGLNPHAGEGGLFGAEEQGIIHPAIEQARRQGISVWGPFPADTLMTKAVRGEYDMVVAMYHDQALIPIKLLAFGRAVNMTVGLPFIRTSVDHGTAYDIAGKGLADPGSLIEAVKLAAQLSKVSRKT